MNPDGTPFCNANSCEVQPLADYATAIAPNQVSIENLPSSPVSSVSRTAFPDWLRTVTLAVCCPDAACERLS